MLVKIGQQMLRKVDRQLFLSRWRGSCLRK